MPMSSVNRPTSLPKSDHRHAQHEAPPVSSVVPLRGSETLTEQAVERMRLAIVSGALAPNAKLRIQSLCEQFGLSATPIREALTRLVANGLVEAIGQKGFRVVPVSLEDFRDIQMLRHMIETHALRQSIERGDVRWESEVVASLHRLSAFSTDATGRLPEGHRDFDVAHKDFHTALLSACGSTRLLALHADLHDQIRRYRVILRLIPRRKEGSAIDHKNLARLSIARDADAAVAALHQHIDLSERPTRKTMPADWQRVLAGRSQHEQTG